MKETSESLRLPNSFFKENPLKELSSAAIFYFSITCTANELWEQLLNDVAMPGVRAGRKEQIRQEQQRIEQMDDPTELVEIMRKGYDIMNRRLLCEKVNALHKQTMPLVLRRYRTCALDMFIETAAMAFALGEKKYVQMLREMYGDIRCPYARASACLVFGLQGMEEEIPFLLSEYHHFRQAYPQKSFEQYPLLALYLLHGK